MSLFGYEDLQLAVAGLPGAVCLLQRQHPNNYRVNLLSVGIKNLTGFGSAELQPSWQAFMRCIHPEDQALLLAVLEDSAICLKNFKQAIRLVHLQGTTGWALFDAAVYKVSANTLNWSVYIKDHSDHQSTLNALELIAHYDVLTRLPNRSLFTDRLQQVLAHARRERKGGAVLFIDLDGFKAINDQYGHEAGDSLLVGVANQMKAALRESDTLARLGGDEFCAVLTGLCPGELPTQTLNRLLKAISMPVSYADHQLSVSGSIGVTLYPQDEVLDPDQLLRQADQAMYQAKLLGKHRFFLFNTELDRKERQRNQTLREIAQGLENEQFLLYYQPKINLRTYAVVGVEALIRWQHPDHGLLSASEFLPLIDSHPLSMQVGDWVIEQVLEKLNAWQQSDIFLAVSINISSEHLNSEGFIDRLKESLARYPKPLVKLLEFELREMNHVDNLPAVIERLTACRDLGIAITFDNFGTGYLSLACLWELPAERIKIDPSFVKDMLNNDNDQAIVRAVIGLAKSFERQVIASGIETSAVADALLSQGCEVGEGYGIAKPMPANKIPDWLLNWSNRGYQQGYRPMP